MTLAAWALAVVSLAVFIVALQVGPSCASNVGPYVAVAFFASWAYLAYHYDRRRP